MTCNIVRHFRADSTLVKALSVPVEENVAVNIPLFSRNLPVILHFIPLSFPLGPHLCRFVRLTCRSKSTGVPLAPPGFRRRSAELQDVSQKKWPCRNKGVNIRPLNLAKGLMGKPFHHKIGMASKIAFLTIVLSPAGGRG